MMSETRPLAVMAEGARSAMMTELAVMFAVMSETRTLAMMTVMAPVVSAPAFAVASLTAVVTVMALVVSAPAFAVPPLTAVVAMMSLMVSTPAFAVASLTAMMTFVVSGVGLAVMALVMSVLFVFATGLAVMAMALVVPRSVIFPAVPCGRSIGPAVLDVYVHAIRVPLGGPDLSLPTSTLVGSGLSSPHTRRAAGTPSPTPRPTSRTLINQRLTINRTPLIGRTPA